MALAQAAAPQVLGVPGDHRTAFVKFTTAGSDYVTGGFTLIPTTPAAVTSASVQTVPGFVRSINFGYGSANVGYHVSVVPVSDTDPSQGVKVQLWQSTTGAPNILVEVPNAGGVAASIYLHLWGK